LSKATNKELLALLNSPNGWLRDRSQQILIQKKDPTISKELLASVKSSNEFSTAIHALYVLDGLNMLTLKILSDIITQSKQPETIAHALGLLEHYAAVANVAKMKTISAQLLAQNNEIVDLYLALSLNAWLRFSFETFVPLLAQIEKKYADKKVFQEAITSSLAGKEENYLKTQNPNTTLKNNLILAINNQKKNELNPIFLREKNEVDNRTKGLQLYRSICATCHGPDGKGIENLAPPLKGSEYIDGSMKRLAAIILHGVNGPITVNGKLYQLNNEMPALLNNKDIKDQDIVDIIRFTQNAFAKVGKGLSTDDVKKQRLNKPTGTGIYNEKLLIENDFEK